MYIILSFVNDVSVCRHTRVTYLCDVMSVTEILQYVIYFPQVNYIPAVLIPYFCDICDGDGQATAMALRAMVSLSINCISHSNYGNV